MTPSLASSSQLNRAIVSVLCLGIVLEATAALFRLSPQIFLPAYIGPEDGLRLRMLRLARVAAFALPVLALFFQGLSSRAYLPSRAVRWGRVGMLCGMIGIPAVLAAASLTRIELRALLPIPAAAIFLGTICGLWLSTRHALRLETLSWSLIALSMGAGMLMGLYAFDLLLPPPDFIGGYNSSVRRLIRHTHSTCIILGLLSIFISRQAEKIRGEA